MVNIGRAVPFVILLVAVIALTRALAGTTIGTTAAIVPLALATIPFFARIVETALREVPGGLVEAALAAGARRREVVSERASAERLTRGRPPEPDSARRKRSAALRFIGP